MSLICRICTNETEVNASPIEGYPLCEDCQDDIMCEECCESSDLYYDEEIDCVLCTDCLLKSAEKRDYLHSQKLYFTDEWDKIGSTRGPVLDYLTKRHPKIHKIQGDTEK